MAMFDVYQDQLATAILEEMVQKIDVVNAMSANTILLGSESFSGDYKQTSFFDRITDLIERRDIDSDAAATDKRLSIKEDVEVVLDFKSRVFIKHEEMLRQGLTMEQATSNVATQFVEEFIKRHLNLSVAAAVAAAKNNSAMYDATLTANKLGYDHLLAADALFDSKYDEVSAYMMSPKSLFALRKDAKDTYKFDRVGGLLIATGVVETMGKPVIVSNIPALTDSVNSKNLIMGLRPSAIQLTERANRITRVQDVTENENLGVRWASEGSVRLGLLGYAYDIASGGRSPSDATLTTGSNWDLITENELTGFSLVEAAQ